MPHSIPRVMSTQHPDNVHVPNFADNEILGGENEIEEAYHAYSQFGCDEQMWDFEGKEVDNFVVKKLLTKHETFFKEKKLGRQLRLTFRVPNPDVERAEAKILLETLESIPRSYDAASLFYENDIAPIFEVILPMCTDALALNRIYHYYKDYVAGKQDKFLQGKMISEWIGRFKPETINVIPLFEDKERMLNAHVILKKYLSDKQLEYQRVFLARSDPAVNYGALSAVLINKIALQRVYRLSQDLRIALYPIIGVGSAPFRGNFRPNSVSRLLEGYPSVQTFTVQSSFKFDNSPELVKSAVEEIKQHAVTAPMEVDERRALDIIERYSAEYARQLRPLAEIINKTSAFVPQRRRRKLHIGLFGYSRKMGEIKLPRAITFTCAMYSLGIPPEILGLNVLTADDWKFVESVYPNARFDLIEPLRYTDINSPLLPSELKKIIEPMIVDTHTPHVEYTRYISNALLANSSEDLKPLVLEAAKLRGFLG